MEAGVTILCFTASYGLSLALEATGLWVQFRGRRAAVLAAAAAGVVAHTWYLGQRIFAVPEAPLSSQHDWFLVGAWLMAVVYCGLVVYQQRSSWSLFVMPLALGLIAASPFADTAPLAGSQGPRFWGQLHGLLLLLGTLAVLMGLVTGVMYLVQSYRLKHKLPAMERMLLPSLEWLERANSRSLAAAAACVGLGFMSGVVLRLATAGKHAIPWSDPVVLSLAAMLAWLVLAEGFRVVYPAARRGRKVAYLTLAAFVFLVVTLVSFTLRDSLHQGTEISEEVDAATIAAGPRVQV
jgi:ABC-type uncharacterized transport system permease subunit